jgi:hypothetical protein
MLDKEVAEERAELTESELEDLKEKLATAEVELDVLKEGESVYHFDIAWFLMIMQREGRLKTLLRRTHWRIFNSRNKMNG